MRINPLDNEDEQVIIRQLAFAWSQVELPSSQVSYTDYKSVLAGLHAITGDSIRTAGLFTAVINQAIHLGYSSEWVLAELKFEAKAEAVGDRTACLRADLEYNGASDTALAPV